MAIDEVTEITETLQPSAATALRTVTDGETTREYVQRPLSFMGKIQFFGLLAKAFRAAAAEDFTAEDALDAVGDGSLDSTMMVIARLVEVMPDFLPQAYCIALRVPEGERAWVCVVWEESLTDDEAFDILTMFLDQNGPAMRDFFTGRMPLLASKVKGMLNEPALSPSSKPSRRTRQSTPSR